jgi:hypothetical protein
MDWKELEFDAALALIFSVSTAYSVEILTGSVYGINLMEPVFQSPFTLTLASAASVAAVAVLWFVNDPNIDRLDVEERFMIVAMLGLMGALILAPDYAPGLLSPIYQDYIWATLALFIEGGGFWTIATA